MRIARFLTGFLFTAATLTSTMAGTFPTGMAKGDMLYWDGTKWERIVVGGADRVLSRVGTDLKPVWRKQPMGSVMDIDGNVYSTVVIGNQEWTVTNLRTTHYFDGTAIPNITDSATWAGLTTGAYCYYNNTMKIRGAIIIMPKHDETAKRRS